MENQLKREVTYINLSIEIEGSNEKTLIKNVAAIVDQDCNLFLAPLLESIKQKGFDDIAGAVIKYYSWPDQQFVFVGKDPIPENEVITFKELNTDKPLRIQLKPC